MIWLLSNIWWLVPVAVALLALSHPAALAVLKRVPARVWAALAAVALLGLTFQAGRWYERSQHRSAQETADARADAKAIKAGGRAQAKAEKASTTISKETTDAAAEVRVILRDRACPAGAELPPRVHELGEQAVERARRALRPVEG